MIFLSGAAAVGGGGGGWVCKGKIDFSKKRMCKFFEPKKEVRFATKSIFLRYPNNSKQNRLLYICLFVMVENHHTHTHTRRSCGGGGVTKSADYILKLLRLGERRKNDD